MENGCEKNHFLIKLWALRWHLYQKSPLQLFFKDFDQSLEELHFRITFWGISTFAEYHRAIASKVKSEIAIHNSVKCFSSHEKMKKALFSTLKKYNLKVILLPKPFLTRGINKLYFLIRWTLFQFTTVVELNQSFTLPLDKVSLKQKQNRASQY